MTPSELDALAARIADSADRRRQDIRMVRESVAAAKQAQADARDSAIFGAGVEFGIKSALDAYAQPIAQATSDAVIADLAARGLIRAPAVNTVKTVKRNKRGLIKSILETPE